MKRFSVYLLVLVMAVMILPGCGRHQMSEATQAEASATTRLHERAADMHGMPNLVNFAEKAKLKRLLELRDDPNLVTYTYLVGEYDATPKFFCESIGFGIPFSAQYSNPVMPQRLYTGGEVVMMPQAEPNAIFPPTSSDATYVECMFGGRSSPVYVESKIIVSPVLLEL